MEQYHCEGCGRELFHFGDDLPPTSCEDCIPETGQGSRLVDQITINLRKLRRKAGIERDELARRAAMSADEIALVEREAAREPGVSRALRLAHSIGVSIDDLADRIYWNPGETARDPEDRRPASERLSGFFLVLPANVPIFDPPPRASVANRGELAEAFGENVRSARERRHLFQKTLAHAAGLSREGLSYIERGIHETTIETMLSIARALQVTPEVLLGGIAWEPLLPPCAPPRRGGAQGHKANSLDGPIKSLWNEGKTGGEIATALSVPRGTVSAIVHRLREHGEDLPYRRPPTRAIHEGARRRRGRQCVMPPHEDDRAVELEETIDAANWKEASDAEITAWLGANVAHHRHAARLTFRELGEAAELDRSYLNRIEKGELLPRLGLIVKLAGCFNVRCGRLTSGIVWEPSFGAFRIEEDGETDTPLKRLGDNALRERRRVGVSQQALGFPSLNRPQRRGRFREWQSELPSLHGGQARGRPGNRRCQAVLRGCGLVCPAASGSRICAGGSTADQIRARCCAHASVARRSAGTGDRRGIGLEARGHRSLCPRTSRCRAVPSLSPPSAS